MSKRELLVCDRCGREIPKGEKFYIVSIKYTRNVDYTAEITNDLDGDICRECLKTFAIQELKLRDEWGV